MDGLLNDCFKHECPTLELNYSGTRKIMTVVDSIYPSVKITIRLIAVDHGCYVEMSKETFCAVMAHASSAITAMNCKAETDIFENEYLNVFTERMYSNCGICFVDHRGVRVNMLVKTFKCMKNKFHKVISQYDTIYQAINGKAADFKIIIDVIFNKMEQYQLDNEEFKNFLSELKLRVETLRNLRAPHAQSHFVDLEDDSFSEEENFGCYKCGCTCNGY